MEILYQGWQSAKTKIVGIWILDSMQIHNITDSDFESVDLPVD